VKVFYKVHEYSTKFTNETNNTKIP